MFDDIAQSNSRQIGIQKGNLDPVNLKRFMNGKPFEFNLSPNAFYQGQYNRIAPEVFNVMNQVTLDQQTITGTIPFQGGQGSQSIYGSQAGKAGQMNSMMLRELDQVINIAENIIKPLMRKWIVYIYELLEPEEIQMITGLLFVPHDDNFDPSYYEDFTIDISTQQTDEVKASELAFLLQTLGNNIPFEMTQLIMSEIARLKKMPNLADQVRQYQPQPDPIEQKMKELQLAQLQAEVQKTQSEVGVKQADAQLKVAKAKEANTTATQKGLNLTKEKYGIDYQRKLQEMQLKHQQELEKLREQMRLKAEYETPQPGLNVAKFKAQPMENKDTI
jgi:hypothetical protein